MNFEFQISRDECSKIFADALVENGRLSKADKVVKTFAKMMSAHRGEVLCTVTTATVGGAGFDLPLNPF